MRSTEEEYIAHLKEGIKDNCLVCDKPLEGIWTDYNGEIKCWNCGATYQILGSHLKDEFLAENSLKKEDIAKRYCPDFQLVPLLREYWQETHWKIPFGTYLGNSPITREEHKMFADWLKKNKERLQEEYKDDFYWDKI